MFLKQFYQGEHAHKQIDEIYSILGSKVEQEQITCRKTLSHCHMKYLITL